MKRIQSIEEQVARIIVAEARAAGAEIIEVDVGHATVNETQGDDDIVQAMLCAGEVAIHFYSATEGREWRPRLGWMFLTPGNAISVDAAMEMICDYGVNPWMDNLYKKLELAIEGKVLS